MDAVQGYLASTRHPARNQVIFLLSVKAGQSAKEIASITWAMVTDASGSIGRTLNLTDEAAKGRSGRIISLNKELRYSLVRLIALRPTGRRMCVTNAARRISTVGGSLRDVQLLAGHSALSTTQRYIDADALAQRKVVELV